MVYLIFFLILVFIFKYADFDLSRLKLFTFFDIAMISIITVLMLVQNSVGLKFQMAIFNFSIKLKEAFFISQFYALLNYLPLKAGLIGEAAQLKMKYGFALNKFILSGIIIYVLNVLSFILIGAFIFLYYDFSFLFEVINIWYLVIFLILFFTTIIIYFLFPIKINTRSEYLNHLNLFFENKNVILNSKAHIFYLFLLIFASLFLIALRLYIYLHALGYDVSFHVVVLMGVFTGLSFFFSFTPGGIGVKEAFLGVMTYLLIGDATIGVVLSMINRVFDLSGLVLFGSYSFLQLKKLKFL